MRSEDNFRVWSLLPPCGSEGLNLGCQAWRQEPLPAEPARDAPTPTLTLFTGSVRRVMVLTQARFRAPFQESLIPTTLGHTLEVKMRLQRLDRCKPLGNEGQVWDHSAQNNSFPGFTTRSTLAQDFPVNNIRVTVSYRPVSGVS